MILPFTTEQLKTLVSGQASEDSMPPPDMAEAQLTVHIFGDASTMLRSRNARSYNFNQVLTETNQTFHNVKFEDHSIEGQRRLSIAKTMEDVAGRFEGGKIPDDHVCLVIWSGSDFIYDTIAQREVIATQPDFYADKLSIMKEAMSRFQRSLFVALGSAEFYEMDEPWQRIMGQVKVLLKLSGIPHCDGHALCTTMAYYRLKTNGKRTWYSNSSAESMTDLVREIGRTCYLVSVLPKRDEVAKGVRTAAGV